MHSKTKGHCGSRSFEMKSKYTAICSLYGASILFLMEYTKNKINYYYLFYFRQYYMRPKMHFGLGIHYLVCSIEYQGFFEIAVNSHTCTCCYY